MLFEAILFLTLLVATFIIVLDRNLDPILVKTDLNKFTPVTIAYATPKLVRLAQAILPAIILLFIIRSFIFEGFRVSSVSMQPTLNAGDWIIVDKYSAGLRVPLLGYRFSKTNLQHGDIIIMRGDIAGQSMPLIKRIIGLPGEHIKIQDSMYKYIHTNLVIPEKSYYVMGDNRADSIDSRTWGVVKDHAIIGKARVKLFGTKHNTKKIQILQTI